MIKKEHRSELIIHSLIRKLRKHFYIAKGSCAEVLTQAIIAQKIGYLDITEFKDLEFRCTELSRMLAKLIAARSNP